MYRTLLVYFVATLLAGTSSLRAAEAETGDRKIILPFQPDSKMNQQCTLWSDGCVSCDRSGCLNNIGIACQPGEVKCITHDEDGEATESQKPLPDAK